MRIKNITIFVLIMIAMVVFSSGCTSKSETTTTLPPTSEIPKTAQLKIMSVTVGQATISQIPITLKVKNIGDAVAKDVYVGGIKVFFMPRDGNFTNKTDLIKDGIKHLLTVTMPAGLVSYNIDTGIPNPYYDSKNIYSNPGVSDLKNLSVGIDVPDSPDYVGDILPGEVKEGHITQIVSSTIGEYVYVKTAWTDDKKEYVIW